MFIIISVFQRFAVFVAALRWLRKSRLWKIRRSLFTGLPILVPHSSNAEDSLVPRKAFHLLTFSLCLVIQSFYTSASTIHIQRCAAKNSSCSMAASSPSDGSSELDASVRYWASQAGGQTTFTVSEIIHEIVTSVTRIYGHGTSIAKMRCQIGAARRDAA